MAAAKKTKPKKNVNKAKKMPGKLKKATKKVVSKHSKTAKKGIKKLVKKAVAKSSKLTKKAIRKHVTSSKTKNKAMSHSEKQTKSMMKPFGDIAVAVIDAVDNALHSMIDPATKTKKR